MVPKWKAPKQLLGVAILLFAFLYLYWVAGDVLRLVGDEGIYLQGGRLVASGQQPYRDFLAIAGPLTFWLEGLFASWSGMSLAVMRIPPILDAAFLAYAVYYLTSRYCSRLYSEGTVIVFLSFEVRLRQLNINHRWDSGALAIAGILLAECGQRTKRPVLWAASGFLIAVAACATPSILLVAIPLLLWSAGTSRSSPLVFVAGGCLAGGTAAAYLASNHALLPMIQSMRWTAANYTQANRIFYGGLPMAGGSAGDWLSLIGYLATLAPAILPPAAIIGWLLYARRNAADSRPMMPLLGVTAALVLSTWPRWTSDALLHTMAPSWALCAVLFYRLTTGWHRQWFCLAAVLVAAGSLTGKAMAAREYELRETRVGEVRAPADESEFLAELENRIQPGDSLFSFPYLPSVYYFLDARNPTYYSFLQPGMMTVADEHRAIRELEAAPPRWVIFENYPPEAVLALWPGSDPARLTLEELTAYLKAHYRPVDTVKESYGGLVLMERNGAASGQ